MIPYLPRVSSSLASHKTTDLSWSGRAASSGTESVPSPAVSGPQAMIGTDLARLASAAPRPRELRRNSRKQLLRGAAASEPAPL